MTNRETNQSNTGEQERVRFTAHLTPISYDAVIQIQQQHRLQEGRALPMWRILDTAVKHYARKKGIQIDRE